MALWGKYDDKSSTGTVEIAANGLVTGSSTLFQAEAQVGDYLVVNSTYAVVISSITSNTECNVVEAKLGTSVNAVGSGANYTLHEAPKYVSFSEVPSAVAGDWTKVYGVDTTEMRAARAGAAPKPAHAGWVRKIEGSGGRAGRVSYEVLVAGGVITGDAEDVSFPDYLLTITANPAAASANSSADEQANFEVTAVTSPTGGSISYLWYFSTDSGSTYASVSTGSGFTGNTTDTLTADANTVADGTLVKCVVSVAGGASANSTAAELTVTS